MKTIEERLDYLEKKVTWINRLNFITDLLMVGNFFLIALVFYLAP